MRPDQVAGHLMTRYRNDVVMVGPHQFGEDSSVQVFLPNGYGISLATGSHGDDYPIVTTIQAKDGRSNRFDVRLDLHPSFVPDRDCTPLRAHKILDHLKNVTEGISE